MVFPIYKFDKSILMNTLSGAVDLCNSKVSEKLKDSSGKYIRNFVDIETEEFLRKRFYIFDNEIEERKEFIKLINHFNNSITVYPKCYLSLTTACNAKCIYCYQRNRLEVLSTRNYVDISELKYALSYVENYFARISQNKRIVKRIILFGGEPFLSENTKLLEEVFTECKKRNIYITAITNGIEVNDFMLLLIKYHHILRSIVITIDGVCEIHNRRRPKKNGDGSFRDISNSVEALLKNNFYTTVQTLIDWNNVFYLNDYILSVREKKWNQSPFFSMAIGKVMFPGLKSSDYEYEMSEVDFIRNAFNIFKVSKDYLSCNLSFGGDLQPYSHLLNLLTNKIGASPKLFGCEALRPGIRVLEPGGLVYPCTQLTDDPRFAIDNYIFNQLKTKTAWKNISPLEIPKCRNCKYLTLCGGGCRSKALIRTLPIFKPICPPIEDIIQTFIDVNSSDLIKCISES